VECPGSMLFSHRGGTDLQISLSLDHLTPFVADYDSSACLYGKTALKLYASAMLESVADTLCSWHPALPAVEPTTTATPSVARSPTRCRPCDVQSSTIAVAVSSLSYAADFV